MVLCAKVVTPLEPVVEALDTDLTMSYRSQVSIRSVRLLWQTLARTQMAASSSSLVALAVCNFLRSTVFLVKR